MDLKVYKDIDALKNDASNLQDGQYVKTINYATFNDFGGGIYKIIINGTALADGGSIIDLSTSVQAELIYDDAITLGQFGGQPNTLVTDILQKAMDFCGDKGVKLIIPPHKYRTENPVTNNNKKLHIEGVTVKKDGSLYRGGSAIVFLNIPIGGSAITSGGGPDYVSERKKLHLKNLHISFAVDPEATLPPTESGTPYLEELAAIFHDGNDHTQTDVVDDIDEAKMINGLCLEDGAHRDCIIDNVSFWSFKYGAGFCTKDTVWDFRLYNMQCRYNHIGAYVKKSIAGMFQNCTLEHNAKHGIYFGAAGNIQFKGGVIEGTNSGHAANGGTRTFGSEIHFSSAAKNISFIATYFEWGNNDTSGSRRFISCSMNGLASQVTFYSCHLDIRNEGFSPIYAVPGSSPSLNISFIHSPFLRGITAPTGLGEGINIDNYSAYAYTNLDKGSLVLNKNIQTDKIYTEYNKDAGSEKDNLVLVLAHGIKNGIFAHNPVAELKGESLNQFAGQIKIRTAENTSNSLKDRWVITDQGHINPAKNKDYSIGNANTMVKEVHNDKNYVNELYLQSKLYTSNSTSLNQPTLGNVVGKHPIYDEHKNFLGYLPIYDSIV